MINGEKVILELHEDGILELLNSDDYYGFLEKVAEDNLAKTRMPKKYREKMSIKREKSRDRASVVVEHKGAFAIGIEKNKGYLARLAKRKYKG